MNRTTVYAMLFLAYFYLISGFITDFIIFDGTLTPLGGGDKLFHISRAESIIAGADYDKDWTLSAESEDIYEAYPPGFSLLFGSIKLILGLNSFHTLIVYRIIMWFSMISLTFILGRLISNSLFGVLSVYFFIFSLNLFSSGISESFTLSGTGPRLNGSTDDVVFITLKLFLIIKIINSDSDQGPYYLLLLLIEEFSHGISHVSRYFSFLLSIIMALSLFSILYDNSNKNRLQSNPNILMIMVVMVIGLSLIFNFYYLNIIFSPYFLGEAFYSSLPFFVTKDYILYSVIIAEISAIILLARQFNRGTSAGFSRGNRNHLPIFSKIIPFAYILLISILIIIITLQPSLIGSQIIPGPYYWGNLDRFFNYKTNEDLVQLWFSFYAIFTFFMFYNGLNFLTHDKKVIGRKSRTKSLFSIIFISGTILFLLSLIFNFHPNRMNLYSYYRPFLLSAGLLYITKHLYLVFRHQNFENIKIKFFVLLLILNVLILPLTLVQYNEFRYNPSMDMMREYDNTVRESSVQSKITYNLMEKVDELTFEGEIVVSSHGTQMYFGAFTNNLVTEDDLLWRYIFSERFEQFFFDYNSRYVVFSMEDMRSVENAEAGKNDIAEALYSSVNNNPNFDLIYTNSFGERIYEHNGENV